MDIHKVLGENVKNMRHQSGLTIERLSNDAGIAFSTLSLIERGQTNPTIDVLEKISDAFHVPVSKLFETNKLGIHDPDYVQQPFKYTERINKLPLKQRRMINNMIGIVLALIDSADKQEEDGDKNSGM